MTFRRILPLILSLCALLTAEAQDIKAATVDASKLLAHYHLAEKELAPLQIQQSDFIKERKQRERALNEVEIKLKTTISVIKDKESSQKLSSNLPQDYNKLVAQYKELSKEVNESDLEKMREINNNIATVSRKLLTEIHQIIRTYAQANGYQWIIETSGHSSTKISPLIYTRDAPDITSDILALLNKDASDQDQPKE